MRIRIININQLKNKMEDKNITRKEAIKKMGKYAAFTALGTMIMLSPKMAQAHSVPGNGHPSGPHGNSGNKVRGFRKRK